MDIETFILVGGRSSRMGRDKASIEFSGMTLAERMAARALDALAGSRVTFVAASPEQFPDSTVLHDIHVDRGPVGGLHTALVHAKTEWMFLGGCDLPFVTAELIGRLSSFIAEETGAIVPVQPDGMAQPLCALYRVDPCLKKAKQMLQNRQTPSLRDLLAEVKTRRVAFDEISDLPGSENFFLNINTPVDLERARRLCV